MDSAEQAPGIPPPESRTWAMGAHLSALAGLLLGGLPAFVGPLVVWLVRRDTDPFAADHARESLNFQLFTILLGVIVIGFGLLTLGLGFVVAALLFLPALVVWLVFVIQGTIAAGEGRSYRYPITVRFIS